MKSPRSTAGPRCVHANHPLALRGQMSEGFNSMAQRAETAERKLAVLKRRTFKGPDGEWAQACPVCVAEFAKKR